MRRRPWVYYPSWVASRLLSAVWFRLVVKGRDRLPDAGAFLLVANHQSFLDPFLLGMASRRVRFVARASLARFPPLRWWLEGVGTVLIRRDAPARSDIETMIATLKAGFPLVLFPEGTRTRDGSVGVFRRGLTLLVKRTGAPVVPAGLRGPFRALPRGRMFPLPVSCALHLGPLIPAEEILAAGGLHRLRGQVAELAGAPLGHCPAEEKTTPEQVAADREQDSSDDQDSSHPDR